MNYSNNLTTKTPYFVLEEVLPDLKETEARLLLCLIRETCSPGSKRVKMKEGHLKIESSIPAPAFFVALGALRRKKLIFRRIEEVDGKRIKFYSVVLKKNVDKVPAKGEEV